MIHLDRAGRHHRYHRYTCLCCHEFRFQQEDGEGECMKIREPDPWIYSWGDSEFRILKVSPGLSNHPEL